MKRKILFSALPVLTLCAGALMACPTAEKTAGVKAEGCSPKAEGIVKASAQEAIVAKAEATCSTAKTAQAEKVKASEADTETIAKGDCSMPCTTGKSKNMVQIDSQKNLMWVFTDEEGNQVLPTESMVEAMRNELAKSAGSSVQFHPVRPVDETDLSKGLEKLADADAVRANGQIGEAGLMAFVDKDGNLVQPTKAEMEKLTQESPVLKARMDQPAAEFVKEVKVNGETWGVSRWNRPAVSVATIGEDGEVNFSCVNGQENAKKVLKEKEGAE